MTQFVVQCTGFVDANTPLAYSWAAVGLNGTGIKQTITFMLFESRSYCSTDAISDRIHGVNLHTQRQPKGRAADSVRGLWMLRT